MPKLGDTAKAYELGYRGNGNMRWCACAACGKERWATLRLGVPIHPKCGSCTQAGKKGALSQNWRGGRLRHSNGYILIYTDESSPFWAMAKHNYIPEHRLIMAQHLDRCLESWEIVHHKNHIKIDNIFENLVLLPSRTEHMPDILSRKLITQLTLRVRDLEARVTLLEAENSLLRGDSLYEKFMEVG